MNSQTNENHLAPRTPVAEVQETEHGFILEVDLPGVSGEGLELSVEQGELTVTGRRPVSSSESKPLHRESRRSDFRRVFALDRSIDSAGITARLEHGVLRLELPRAESMKPRKISVAG